MMLRVRGPSGQATLKVEPTSSIAEFQELLAGKTGILSALQEILGGFPPRPLQLPEDRAGSTVASLGIQPGDSLIVNRAANALPPQEDSSAAAPAAAPPAVDISGFHVDGMSEDEQLARALALSMEEAGSSRQEQPQQHLSPRSAAAAAAAARAPVAPPPQPVAPPSQPQQPLPKPRAASPVRSHPPPSRSNGSNGVGANVAGLQQVQQAAAGGAPICVPLPGGAAVVRRIIDSDNSCLFNAVGYVMEGSRARAPALRAIIARDVMADPLSWNEAVLGKEPADYCSWIQQKQNWGGAIELSILSRHYGREIAAFDIQTKRVDVYGQDAGYTERALVIYDGLHYDALAVAAYPGAPESKDTTVVPASGEWTEQVMAGAADLVAKAHQARQFTDTANFTLRCGICQLGFKGEKEAVAHARSTGHANFQEY